jgi:glycosyltransferase involved in cell wall biosynthesis
VIVVDDNSDAAKVSFDRFPVWKGRHYRCVFTKEGRGAGYARNVGLMYAEGKWVTFMDADDFYSAESSAFFDRMADAEEDLIIFDHRSVLSSDINTSVVRSAYLSSMIDDYLSGRIDENRIRCNYIVSTCKLIRRDLIEKHHIRFNETRWSNDNYFSAQVSCYAKSIKVCNDVIYVMTVRDGSLMSDFCGTRKEAMIRLQEAIKSERLYYSYGLTTMKDCLSAPLLRTVFIKHGYWWCLGSCALSLFNPPVFRSLFGFLFNKAIHHIAK